MPMAFLVYVALITFYQKGLSCAESTLCTSFLLLPWLLKPFLQKRILCKRAKCGIIVSELACAIIFGIVSVYISMPTPLLTASFAGISLSALCHHLFSERYRQFALDHNQKVLLGHTFSMLQHLFVLLTYGAFIIVVGTLQIYYRQFSTAWGMGCRILCFIMLFLSIYHIWALKNTETPIKHTNSQAKRTLTAETGLKAWTSHIILFLILLPQSLMFHARTLFLLDSDDVGGLNLTLQEIGFAQGTVGMIAFILGISIFHKITQHLSHRNQILLTGFIISLSPIVYLVFTNVPPSNLVQLCVGTFIAQLCFGIGIGACSYANPSLSGKGYHILFEPASYLSMIVPMACSGMMVQAWGYLTYFIINTACAVLCWIAMGIQASHAYVQQTESSSKKI